jgi:hypothetical protein
MKVLLLDRRGEVLFVRSFVCRLVRSRKYGLVSCRCGHRYQDM